MVNASFVRNVATQEANSAVASHLTSAGHAEPLSIDSTWTLMSAVLVFMMQLGFGLLEAGSIQSINSQSILFKNLLDVAIVTIGWWAFGYALASSTGNSFAGDSTFTFSKPQEEWIYLFFNWTFAATSATIVSGAVAGRMRLQAYLATSTIIGWIVFPIFAHWVWATNGWLYKRGFIDFAGSGVVHLNGGASALAASLIVGPRNARFEYIEAEKRWVDRKPRGHSVMMTFLGTVLLWFGWFGFNAGSSLGMSGGRYIVSVTCLFNSSLTASCAILSMTVLGFCMPGNFSLTDVLNAALAGLVAITAGCATQTAWGAVLTGCLAGPLYKASSVLVAKARIDDPVDAISVHGTCGILGLILPAMFTNQQLINRAYGDGEIEWELGHQLGVQLTGAICMIVFAMAIVTAILLPWKYFIPGGIRISERDELVGNDYGYFGGYAYPDWEEMVRQAKAHDRRKQEIKRRKDKMKFDKLKKGGKRGRRRKPKPTKGKGAEGKEAGKEAGDKPSTSNVGVGLSQPNMNSSTSNTSKQQSASQPPAEAKERKEAEPRAYTHRGSVSDGMFSQTPENISDEMEHLELLLVDLQERMVKLRDQIGDDAYPKTPPPGKSEIKDASNPIGGSGDVGAIELQKIKEEDGEQNTSV